MDKQAIILPGVGNARQLGGYVIGDKRIKPGLLLRTAALDHISPEGIEKLKDEYRLQTVADLRMSSEAQAVPDPDIPGANNIHFPIIELEDMMGDADPEMIKLYTDPAVDRMTLFDVIYSGGAITDQLYIQFLLDERGKKSWKRFFEALLAVDDDRAFLWHCTDGKDRTGCAAMLILLALGADRETAISDYMLTNYFNEMKLTMVRQKAESLRMPDDKKELLLFISGGVVDNYMNNAIDELTRRYGSVQGYLSEELGVGKEEIEILRKRYLI